ncbi:ade6 [Symbiodinium sp. CCMP2592]|nr:ade6 [Symbiodinium sp. CCMP2592]
MAPTAESSADWCEKPGFPSHEGSWIRGTAHGLPEYWYQEGHEKTRNGPPPRISIGTHEDAHVKVDDSRVASRHCMVFKEGRNWFLEGVSTKRPINLGDTMLEPGVAYQLSSGDVFSLDGPAHALRYLVEFDDADNWYLDTTSDNDFPNRWPAKMPGHPTEAPPAPEELKRLAWQTDQMRRRSEEEQVLVADWAAFSQYVKKHYHKYGIFAEPWQGSLGPVPPRPPKPVNKRMSERAFPALTPGQLGRMMVYAGHRLGVKMCVLDPLGEKSPAGQVAEMSVKGSFQDADSVRELSKKCDILTLEVEHVNAEVLEELHQAGVPVQPLPFVVKLIQDKYVQKVHLQKHGVPLPDFEKVESEADLHSIGERFGYPMMLKSRYGAYDGKGNAVVPNAQGITAAFEKLGGKAGKKLYVEKWAPFKMELAVMVARGVDETMNVTMRTYPVVHTVQRDSVCFTCLTPPVGVTQKQQELAQKVATDAIKSFGDARGIFGVEMFLLHDGSVLLNEIAPRPHNTGHYTIEACGVDQFEQHLRCVLGLPLGDCQLRVGGAMMVNILGQGETPEMVTKTMAPLRRALLVPDAGIHWYGKEGCVKGRKMGHITVTGFTPAAALEAIRPVLVAVDGDDAASKHDVPTKPSPSVGIIMGSDSDLPTMKDAAQVLDDFGIPYEISVVSAHRTPEYMYEYATTAEARGINVIIAGAGGAAHLPGMVAALTPLPVIGVPVKSSALSGNDSLLSIVQMPKGIPVATVAIGNAANAGLLAVRILGAANPGQRQKMAKYMAAEAATVEKKRRRLEQDGWQAYLAVANGNLNGKA